MTTKIVEQTTKLPLDLCKIITHFAKEPTRRGLILTVKSQFPSITHPIEFFYILALQCKMVVLYCNSCKKNICIWTAQDNRFVSLLPIHLHKGCDLKTCSCMILYKNKPSVARKIALVNL